jgi:hypothetical protein
VSVQNVLLVGAAREGTEEPLEISGADLAVAEESINSEEILIHEHDLIPITTDVFPSPQMRTSKV